MFIISQKPIETIGKCLEEEYMEEITYKNINAEDFARLDFSKVTLVDLREPDEVLVSGIEGAINIPFSSFPKGLDDSDHDVLASHAGRCLQKEKHDEEYHLLCDRMCICSALWLQSDSHDEPFPYGCMLWNVVYLPHLFCLQCCIFESNQNQVMRA